MSAGEGLAFRGPTLPNQRHPTSLPTLDLPFLPTIFTFIVNCLATVMILRQLPSR